MQEVKGQDTRKALEKLIETKEIDYPDSISDSAKNLMMKMLQKDPTMRSDITELIHDPFFKQNKIPPALPMSCLTKAPPTEFLT